MTSEHNQLHHQDIVRIKDDKQNVIEGNLTVPKTIDIDIKGIVILLMEVEAVAIANEINMLLKY